MNAAIIGGGAAGFFLAIHLQRACPGLRVNLFERNGRTLSKVRISGGGRCNLTNSFAGVRDLCTVYPRGHRLMKRLLREFGAAETFAWFEAHGVPLTTQEDECVFPRSQSSDSVVLCLRREAEKAGVEVLTGHAVERVTRCDDGTFGLEFAGGIAPRRFDAVALTTGGAPRGEGHSWLAALGHQIEKPCPALFTFGIDEPKLTELSGIVVKKAQASIAGTKLRADGPLLITHWGMSGPAILKLSSYAARRLHERGYRDRLIVCWISTNDTARAATRLRQMLADAPRKQLGTLRPYGLQGRLWQYLLLRAGLTPEKPCAEVGAKGINRLATVLTADGYDIAGRGAFREEFVTCGGVSLESIVPSTMESRHCPGLFFAGEVLDIDAVTGGFNFQAAWTTAYIAARAMAARFAPAGTDAK